MAQHEGRMKKARACELCGKALETQLHKESWECFFHETTLGGKKFYTLINYNQFYTDQLKDIFLSHWQT